MDVGGGGGGGGGRRRLTVVDLSLTDEFASFTDIVHQYRSILYDHK